MEDFGVIALMSAYNEEDIIGTVIGDLVHQGIEVYLLDDGSTDGTVSAAERYLGHGLLYIERHPAGEGEGDAPFVWERILRRKQALAEELDADWFIHHDADEFRESPWPDVNLRDAIRRVDRLGYTAIDFELLNFRPTGDGLAPTGDIREALPYYEPGEAWNKVQIKCWKKGPVPVDLASSGGHEAIFQDRRVFPLRFLLRHYPIRGQTHGRRKILLERLPRFLQAERERGWHVQYDSLAETGCFLWDPASLLFFDPEAVRVHLAVRNRLVDELSEHVDQVTARASELAAHVDGLASRLQGHTRELAALHAALESARVEAVATRQELAALHAALESARAEAVATRQELAAVYASRSWRVTAPLRAAARWLLGR